LRQIVGPERFAVRSTPESGREAALELVQAYHLMLYGSASPPAR
jgi:hypothetical protein